MNKINCPCSSCNTIRRGFFQNRAHGKQQRYFCKNCKKKFIQQTAFYRIRNNPQKITLCLDLFYRKVLAKTKNKSKNKFETITTDGFFGYTKSVKSVFGYNHFQRGEKTHKVVTQLKDEGFNVRIEKMHNSIRHRIKTFRGFHGSVSSASAIMKGYELYYNFIRKHLALGKTPSELATDVKLENPNKWLKLIKMNY